jgi:NAD(P)-dependent dehydrogenase (short-subunit alcohol dehydrogenase family)
MTGEPITIVILGVVALGVWLWLRRNSGASSREGETRLRRICLGDDSQVDRLIKGEMARAPGISLTAGGGIILVTMDLQIDDKTALVTGSTAGIGLAIASALAGEGARVIVNGRTRKRVDNAMGTISAAHPGAKLDALPLDLSTAAGAADAVALFPDVDVLVNNLGIFEAKPFDDIPDADWLRFFETNVMSGVRLSRAYLPGMRSRNWGRIVFVSSESGLHIPAEMVHYGVTKTAQIAVARGIAETCAGTGVTCNAVLPGPTASEGVKDFVGSLAKQSGKSVPEVEKEFFLNVRPTSLLKRFARTDEVAAMVVFVCSSLASATNGAALRVDGGVVKSPF